MKIYAIGGLGADERIFSELKLDFDLCILPWIKPEPTETIGSYAKRFVGQINTSKPFVIIGVSFGGMLAIEICKILKPEKTILISSAVRQIEIPAIFRIIGRIGVFSVIPIHILQFKPPVFLIHWLFGVRDPKHQKLLTEIIRDTDVHFLRWALGAISKWKNELVPENLIRIHGTYDRLLACHQKENTHLINSGGHFMVVDKADEMRVLLNEIIGTDRSKSIILD